MGRREITSRKLCEGREQATGISQKSSFNTSQSKGEVPVARAYWPGGEVGVVVEGEVGLEGWWEIQQSWEMQSRQAVSPGKDYGFTSV